MPGVGWGGVGRESFQGGRRKCLVVMGMFVILIAVMVFTGVEYI